MIWTGIIGTNDLFLHNVEVPYREKTVLLSCRPVWTRLQEVASCLSGVVWSLLSECLIVRLSTHLETRGVK